MLLQKAKIKFPAPTLGGSQTFVTSDPGDLTPRVSGTCTKMHASSHKHQTLRIRKSKMNPKRNNNWTEIKVPTGKSRPRGQSRVEGSPGL